MAKLIIDTIHFIVFIIIAMTKPVIEKAIHYGFTIKRAITKRLFVIIAIILFKALAAANLVIKSNVKLFVETALQLNFIMMLMFIVMIEVVPSKLKIILELMSNLNTKFTVDIMNSSATIANVVMLLMLRD